MTIALWIAQILLALAFLMAGAVKIAKPREELRENMAFVEDFGDGAVKFIGVAEVLGAIGVVLPAATGIAPILTPLAATGLAITMVIAGIVHVRRNEPFVPNIVLFALATFVAWGRFGPEAL